MLFSYSPWRRTVWVLVLVFMLALAHLAFQGPAKYATGRWPSTIPVYRVVFAYTPLLPNSGPVRLYYRYLDWWFGLGVKHSGHKYGPHFNDPNRTSIPK